MMLTEFVFLSSSFEESDNLFIYESRYVWVRSVLLHVTRLFTLSPPPPLTGPIYGYSRSKITT